MGAGRGWDSFFDFFVQFESGGKKCYNKQQLSSLLKNMTASKKIKQQAVGFIPSAILLHKEGKRVWCE